MIKEQVQQLAKDIHEDTIAMRRHLHQHPELSFEEYQTSAFVKSRLAELGIPYRVMADTGVVAEIVGDLPSADRVVALRADMDALPIQEVEGRPYGSQRAGVMHACGHDAHTASLLSAARILKQLTPHFGGTVRLIFQPGEERLPGGASLMIKEGVLEHPKPEAVVGQHVMPMLPAGTVGFRAGKYMASADELYMTVTGRGGHGAQPQQNIDPVVITAHIITALQQVVSRYGDPRIPSVLSFGKVIAEGATNIIPNEVYLEGTFRTLDEKWRKEAHDRMRKIAEGMAESMGATCDFDIRVGYPFLVNDEQLTQQTRQSAEEYLGADNVVELDIWMAGEDFAYYSQMADACFYRLGTGNVARGITAAVHTPEFDIDESALEIGAGLMAYIALRRLGIA